MTGLLNTLLVVTVYSTVLFAAILIFQRLFRRRISAALHCAVWALLILRLVIPVTIDSGWHLFTVPQAVQTMQPQNTADSDTIETPAISSAVQPISDKAMISSQPQFETESVADQSANPVSANPLDWQTITVIAWATGAFGFLTYTSVRWVQLSRRIKRSSLQTPAFVRNMVEAEKRALRIHSDIRISVQSWLVSPALSASLRPVLLLPKHLLQEGDALRFGIRHELTHYRRKDHLLSLLLLILRCVYWFNPVVWLAFRRIQIDMEAACDAAVTGRMAECERTRYIHTMIDMGLCAKQPLYALGMGAGYGRKVLEKRVRGMFMTKRTGLSARMAAALLALLMLFACFTTACQPTPEKPIVVNKNEGVLEAAVAATPAPAAKYEAPEKWQEIVKRDGSNITLEFDASVVLPDVDAYPVKKIKPGQFSQEQADRIVSVLFKDAKLYNSAKPRTKSELEQELVNAKAALEQKKIDPESNDDSEAGIQQSINIIEQAILTAPEVVNEQLASTLLQLNEYGEVRLDIKADLGKKQNATLWLMNHGDNILSSLTCFARFVNTDSGGSFRRLDECGLTDDSHISISITEDDAITQAKQLVSDLGITGMDVAEVSRGIIGGGEGEDVSQNPQCYMVYFTRTIDGIPTVFTTEQGGGLSIDFEDVKNGNYPADFRPPWRYERVLVCVDDTGIVQFDWDSPIELLVEETENVSLLPFEQIQERFSEQMYLDNSYFKDNALIASQTFRIEKVTLGLHRIPSKNNLDEYLLIPVWNFFGSTKENYNIDAVPEMFSELSKEEIEVLKNDYQQRSDQYYTIPYRSFLTINAIDGSIINPNIS